MSEAVRRAVCLFVLPVLPFVIKRLRDEVEKTKNEWDDLGVELLNAVYEWLRLYVCK